VLFAVVFFDVVALFFDADFLLEVLGFLLSSGRATLEAGAS